MVNVVSPMRQITNCYFGEISFSSAVVECRQRTAQLDAVPVQSGRQHSQANRRFMIVFELICAANHRFEGWFASGEDFEQQRHGGLLTCPVCSTDRVAKLPTAKLGRSASAKAAEPARQEAKVQVAAPTSAQLGAAVAAFIDVILQATEDVGRAFPAEARRIHREEAPRRGIRGTATREETEALLEEGIAILSLPIPPREDYH